MEHLHTMWIGNTKKALTSELNKILQFSINGIDPRLWVTVFISAITHTIDNEFNILVDYPKGCGDLFDRQAKARPVRRGMSTNHNELCLLSINS